MTSDNVSALLDKARQQIDQTDSREKVLDLLRTYESVLEVDPANYEALWSLGRYNVVMVLGYTINLAEKREYNLTAIRYCEQAMNTNPEFKALRDKGEKVSKACRVLTKREMAPLYYWYAGTGSCWKECFSRTEKLRHWHWARSIPKVLNRMMEIDPTWAGGHPYYAWAHLCVTIPRIAGGDLKKAEEFYNKAIEAGPNWLYIRWGRAKYFHTRKKDRQSFLNDLQWVISQDPHKADSPYPANVYFQKDAREMLASIDKYF